MRFLAPQTRPKKDTELPGYRAGEPYNHPHIRSWSFRGARPFLRRTYSDPDVPQDPQESISETRERMSGPQIADDTRPGLGNTVRGFARGRRGLKQAPAWYFQLARREQWTTTG